MSSSACEKDPNRGRDCYAMCQEGYVPTSDCGCRKAAPRDAGKPPGSDAAAPASSHD